MIREARILQVCRELRCSYAAAAEVLGRKGGRARWAKWRREQRMRESIEAMRRRKDLDF